jgi:dTDP-4-dehydrorhamnose reductase
LMEEKDEVGVVNDQLGSPTYAADLAEAILYIISNCKKQIENSPGIFHYSNKGIISWYEFALAIKEIIGSTCRVNPITTEEYPTATKRPAFSALDTTRIQEVFGVRLKDWKTSLATCVHQIKKAP